MEEDGVGQLAELDGSVDATLGVELVVVAVVVSRAAKEEAVDDAKGTEGAHLFHLAS